MNEAVAQIVAATPVDALRSASRQAEAGVIL